MPNNQIVSEILSRMVVELFDYNKTAIISFDNTVLRAYDCDGGDTIRVCCNRSIDDFSYERFIEILEDTLLNDTVIIEYL